MQDILCVVIDRAAKALAEIRKTKILFCCNWEARVIVWLMVV
jgi:hypothetical protein